jgi:hypothetical protein
MVQTTHEKLIALGCKPMPKDLADVLTKISWKKPEVIILDKGTQLCQKDNYRLLYNGQPVFDGVGKDEYRCPHCNTIYHMPVDRSFRSNWRI